MSFSLQGSEDMFSHPFNLVVLSAALLLVSACGGGSDNATEPELLTDLGSGGDTTAIAGLWDISRSRYLEQDPPIRVSDTVYLEIGTDGVVREIDYDDDGWGSGENCYYIYEGRLKPTEGKRYRYRRWAPNESGTPTIIENIVWINVSPDILEWGFDDQDYLEIFNTLWGVDTEFPECPSPPTD